MPFAEGLGGLRPGVLDVGDHHLGAGGHECLRHSFTEALSAAGHE